MGKRVLMRVLAVVAAAVVFIMLSAQSAPANTGGLWRHWWWRTTTTSTIVAPPAPTTTTIVAPPAPTTTSTSVAPPAPTTTTTVVVPPAPPTTSTTVAPPAPTTTTTVALPQLLLSDNFSGYPLGLNWIDSSVHGNWTSVFNGYGANGITSATGRTGTPTDVISETPMASTSPGETHAGLVTSNATFGDMDMTVDVRTSQQLRTPVPNGWETGWVAWDFTSQTQFYYFNAKPNGWELGKEDPAYPGNQRFLATGNTPFPIGAWYSVRIRQVGNTMSVWVNGALITTFTDTERPYQNGRVGLYTEDASAQFANVKVALP